MACWAFSAFFFTVAEISSIEAEVSSRPAACSSVRCDRSVVDVEISAAAFETSRAVALICEITSDIVSSRPLTPPHSVAISPALPSSGTRWVKSLSFAEAITSCVCCTASCSAWLAMTCAVTSVAYFTTLNGLPFISMIGL